MQINIIEDFYAIPDDSKSQVFEIIPNQFGDARGKFCEVLKKQTASKPNAFTDWVLDMDWIKQVNRSESVSSVVRGMHAQKGASCQGKLVQCVSGFVYDIIIDSRPDSQTFGKTKAFKLDSSVQNMLWVPRGFLHGFGVPHGQEKAVFEYFCDNVYDKASEFSVNPVDVAKSLNNWFCDQPFKYVSRYIDLVRLLDSDITFSEKDAAGIPAEEWLHSVRAAYESKKEIWYR